MWRYTLVRILSAIPVIAVVGVITFSIIHIAPGDPAAIIGGDEATVEDLERIREELGTDQPIHVQFVRWIGRLAQGDLGTSIFSRKSITSLMAPRLQPTLSLGVQVILLSTFLGISIGVISAWKAGTVRRSGLHVLRRAGLFRARILAGVHTDMGLCGELRVVPCARLSSHR